MILNTPLQGFVACGEAIKFMHMRPTNPAITAPTFVICGNKTIEIRPSKQKKLLLLFQMLKSS
jgi:hypothetical protein